MAPKQNHAATLDTSAFTSRAHNDTLLRGLTENQRAYIIKHLYPSLREAIASFAIEAQRSADFELFINANPAT